MRIRFRWVGRNRLAVIGLLGALGVCRAQTGNPVTISGFRPLYDLARQLEDRYARPVTIENALEKWAGELHRLPSGGLGESPHSIVLPESDGIFSAPGISIDLVRRALDEFHRQNPDRSRFKVIESKIGFHIVPTDAHDEAGVLRPIPGILDTTVSVPAQARTFTGHLGALVEAVSAATGIRFWPLIENFDAKYAANGYFLRYPQLKSPKDRPYLEFEWGTNGVSARDALIELLAGSATTMTWELACGPEVCNLKIASMVTGGRALYLDRCTKCKPIPTQAGKTSQQVEADLKSGGR
jgi:hypothetical protein